MSQEIQFPNENLTSHGWLSTVSIHYFTNPLKKTGDFMRMRKQCEPVLSSGGGGGEGPGDETRIHHSSLRKVDSETLTAVLISRIESSKV